ncbi:MAG: hypothetical protein ACR2JR_15490 [Rubrobacteraceae bacterium]
MTENLQHLHRGFFGASRPVQRVEYGVLEIEASPLAYPAAHG